MRSEVRGFRIPIVLTLLMLLGLGGWTWQSLWGANEHALEKERHRARMVFDMLTNALSALEGIGRLERGEIERLLGGMLQASRYRFFIVECEDRRALQIGDIPSGFKPPSREEAAFSDGLFVFSRKIRFPEREKRKTPWTRIFGDGSSGLDLSGHEFLLILGGDAERDRIQERAVAHLLAPLVAVFLLLSASAVAWFMTVRNRFLVERLKTECARSAHLEDLGLAAAGLAHETKNPLGIISGIAQQIVRDPKVPEQSRAMIETIIDEVDKSASRLGNFMTFARRREVAAAPFEIRRLIARIVEILQPEIDAAGVVLETECPAVSVLADEEMLRQILVNLLLNSLQASSPGGVIAVRLKRHGVRASILVEDHGRGIPEDLVPNVFKPYVTGRSDGHGLGLAIVKRFAEDHGWTVEAESQVGRGTLMRVSGILLSEGTRTRA